MCVCVYVNPWKNVCRINRSVRLTAMHSGDEKTNRSEAKFLWNSLCVCVCVCGWRVGLFLFSRGCLRKHGVYGQLK